MKREMNQASWDLPQLQQMVLENTERINRNKHLIDLMRMEKNRQSNKLSDIDQRAKSFREEFEESMRRSAERMDRLERFAETSRLEQEKRSRDLDARFAETDRQLKETSLEVNDAVGHAVGEHHHLGQGSVRVVFSRVLLRERPAPRSARAWQPPRVCSSFHIQSVLCWISVLWR